MPIYEFLCLDCKKSFELTRQIERYDPRKVKCPECESKKVERSWSEVFVETSRKS
ncbi:MAG: zinc ribbon domain-containing protein [Acidobacteriota bacterium]